MKKLSLAFIAVFTYIFIVYSCSNRTSDEPTDTTTTVAQDKQNIKNTFSGFYDCMNTLDDGDFSNFLLYSFFNNTNHEFNTTYLEKIFDVFENQYGTLILNDRFQFANRTGIYTWNNSTKLWSKQTNSNSIIFKFPAKENQTIDTEAAIEGYNDALTRYGNNSLYMPKAFNFIVKRSEKTIFSANLSNVTFDNSTNFSMPLTADITIYTAPFTHKIKWNRLNTKEFEFNYTSSTPNGCSTVITSNILLQNDNYGSFTSLGDDVKQIKGSISEGNLKINYSANIEVLGMFDDPTINQINSNTKAEVFYNNKKIGDLTLKNINNQDEIFIIYSDGTSENVDVYAGDFESKIKAIFANYL